MSTKCRRMEQDATTRYGEGGNPLKNIAIQGKENFKNCLTKDMCFGIIVKLARAKARERAKRTLKTIQR